MARSEARRRSADPAAPNVAALHGTVSRVAPTTIAPTMIALTTIAVAVLAGITGCTAPAPTPTPSQSAASSATPSPTSSPQAAPTFKPDGTASDNLVFFNHTNEAFFAANGKSDGQSITTNLAAAGFSKADMQVTYDSTAIGLAADSIVFSVQLKGECLVGQFTPIAYAGILAPVLGTGGCLVGETRPIDW